MRIFSHDPGTSNYGVSVVAGKFVNGRLKIKVLENGLLQPTIKDLKDHGARRRQKDAYLSWCAEKVEQYDLKYLIAERYQTRGIKGLTVECVGMMLGLLQSLGLKDAFIPASQWKNALTRAGIVLDEAYRRTRVTPHQLDATLIGIYALHKNFGLVPFTAMHKDWFECLLREVEKTSTSRLINRKGL